MQENSTTTMESAAQQEIPLQFNGKASEYFGIWIVNVLLTIVTLGIYAPWAKVRTKRYFYGNTLLANSPFDFVANPMTILKGYLIALGFYIAFSVTSEFYPLFSVGLMLVFLLVLPWIVVRSMSFRLANTTYRNIRFNFERDYNEAYKVFLGLTLLIPVTFGLIFPYYHFRQSKFVIDKSRFGKSNFGLDLPAGSFYRIYIIIWLLFMALGLFMVVLMPLMVIFMPEMAGVEQAVADSPEIDPEQQKNGHLHQLTHHGLHVYFLHWDICLPANGHYKFIMEQHPHCQTKLPLHAENRPDDLALLHQCPWHHFLLRPAHSMGTCPHD